MSIAAMIVGTAGWGIPATERHLFPAQGPILERYAQRFRGVEINSSFYKPHRHATWVRWAGSVPDDFRFAVKFPREISHNQRLRDASQPLMRFLDEVGGLGSKLSVLLLQLPPTLAFDHDVAEAFLATATPLTSARLACEPRHPSWFGAQADTLLERLGVARVAADPALGPDAARPGGWRSLTYWRLHGSPHMYRSSYDPDRLDRYASLIDAERRAGRTCWCIFDNTAAFAATGNALAMMERLG